MSLVDSLKRVKFDKTRLYMKCIALANLSVTSFSTIPNKYKHTIGDKIVDNCFELCTIASCVYEEKLPSLKHKHLADVLRFSYRVMSYFRVLNELNVISKKDYTESTTLLIDIMEQAKSWQATIQPTMFESSKTLPNLDKLCLGESLTN